MMGTTNVTFIDVFMMALPIIPIIYFLIAGNPHDVDTEERASLSAARTWLVLALMALGLGVIGVVIATATLIMGVKTIIRGRTMYGLTVILISIFVPIFSFIPLWN
ncbi:MAG: hypothetical protein H8D24_03190 [Gammaproteobacteria bacterium]|uniref:Uncharacterized protein n=1 Tax=Candidatus Thiopontia autotrophica TaxID=2841688 RepID=A0A8J6PAI6_9GAMM|nr:hypothetical protein [Candidatus Thiopontia autotrophica]